VYADETRTESDESATLAHLEDPNEEELTGETYGALKVLCEQTVESLLPGRVLTVRSGLIVGPHDPTDRFTYWPVRIAKGGEVLAPGNPNRQVQFIDARDQAAWIMKMIAAGQNGIFNVTGPERLTMRGLLDTCREASKSDARLTWVDEIFLLEQGVRPWVDLPLWLPDSFNGMMTLNISKALAAGLTFRPLSETVADTLRWNASRPAEDTSMPKAGMMLDQEAQMLSAWKARR
jgi:2'-hydroxyisoflavone reductase